MDSRSISATLAPRYFGWPARKMQPECLPTPFETEGRPPANRSKAKLARLHRDSKVHARQVDHLIVTPEQYRDVSLLPGGLRYRPDWRGSSLAGLRRVVATSAGSTVA